MTALDAFLYGMPFVLMAGAGVTLWFAKRAAREIDGHTKAKRPIMFVVPSAVEPPNRSDVSARPRVGAL